MFKAEKCVVCGELAPYWFADVGNDVHVKIFYGNMWKQYLLLLRDKSMEPSTTEKCKSKIDSLIKDMAEIKVGELTYDQCLEKTHVIL